uniref:DUF4614 domain-containing protein n=1 Tax=Mesocestoides corti TaxID=53468 RepID=A0A5K3F8V3_MESCO
SALTGASFINTNKHGFVPVHPPKTTSKILDSDEGSRTTSRTAMSFNHLSSTPKPGLSETLNAESDRQDEEGDTNPHYSESFISSTSTRMKSSMLQPAPSKRTQRDPTSRQSFTGDENSLSPVIRSFDDFSSVMGEDDKNCSGSATSGVSDNRKSRCKTALSHSDHSQSASPTLSSLSDNSTRRNAAPASFTYEDRSECEGTDGYSDDFESSDEEDKCENVTQLEIIKEPEVIRPINKTSLAKESTTQTTSDTSQATSPPTPLQFVSGGNGSTSGDLSTEKSKTSAPRKAKDAVEKAQFRNAGTLTDTSLWSVVGPASWQHPSIQPGWYDQSAFVAAVTAAVGQITARQTDPQPILKAMLESKNVVDTVTSYNPCVTVLDNMLRQQLKLTRQFLASHRAMHDTLMAALQKCVVPPLTPINLRLNYTSQPMKPL